MTDLLREIAPSPSWLRAARDKEAELLALGVPRGRIVDALKLAARWGLMPDGQEFAIYSFRKRNGEMVCMGFPMVGGLRRIALASRKVTVRNANAIFPGQKWEYREGSDRYFVHHVSSGDRNSTPTHVYAFAKFKGGDWDVELWSWSEIEKFRESVGRREEWGSVWDKFPVAMAKAKVTKKLLARYVILEEEVEGIDAIDRGSEEGPSVSTDTKDQGNPTDGKPAVVDSEVSGLLP